MQRSKEIQRVKQGVYTKLEQKYLQKYGYVKVLDKYDAHATIADQLTLPQNKIIQLNKIVKKFLHKIPLTRVIASLYEVSNGKMKLKKKVVFPLK